MKKFFTLAVFLTYCLCIEGSIGSPSVSTNSQGNYLIEIQINDFNLQENDVSISNFKSNDSFPKGSFDFKLYEDLGEFKRLTLALPSVYLEDYFSFRLSAGSLSKDIFIFLPQNTSASIASANISFKLPSKKIYGEPTRYNIDEALSGDALPRDADVKTNIKREPLQKTQQTNSLPEKKATKIIKASEVETIWSASRSVQKSFDASIYQIMWAFYLANPDAFIDDNIHLVRGDVDLVIPSFELVSSTSLVSAKEAVGFMRQKSAVNNPKAPSLTLTAPISNAPTATEVPDSTSTPTKDTILNPFDAEADDDLDPSSIIEKNTSIIELGTSSNDSMQGIDGPRSSFQLSDLLWVAILSLGLGFAIAFFFIRANRKPEFSKAALEEDLESDSFHTFQTNLSVTNDIEVQELDLVRTYIAMGDWISAEAILSKLIQSSANKSVVVEAKDLLSKKV